MRRKDKEITDRKLIDSIIGKSLVCRVAMCDDETPYVVPLCFGYDGLSLYFHSAAVGRKLDILWEFPDVCFEFDADCEVVPADKPCSFSMRYRSVIGFGRAVFLEDIGEKLAALRIIMNHYTDRRFPFTEQDLANIAIVRIDIEQITGKQAGFKD